VREVASDRWSPTTLEDAMNGLLTSPTVTPPTRGKTMAEKSPSQHNAKKVGKSLKEKRTEKHAKKESKKGVLGS
jgi:hypothetical protein